MVIIEKTETCLFLHMTIKLLNPLILTEKSVSAGLVPNGEQLSNICRTDLHVELCSTRRQLFKVYCIVLNWPEGKHRRTHAEMYNTSTEDRPSRLNT